MNTAQTGKEEPRARRGSAGSEEGYLEGDLGAILGDWLNERRFLSKLGSTSRS